MPRGDLAVAVDFVFRGGGYYPEAKDESMDSIQDGDKAPPVAARS